MADQLSRINVITSKLPSLHEAQSLDKEVQEMIRDDKRVIMEDNIAALIKKDGSQVIILPKVLQFHAMEEAHGTIGGHFNYKKTYMKISELY